MPATPPKYYDEQLKDYRERHRTERPLDLKHAIDPGFVNRRLCDTVLGERAVKAIDEEIRALPDLPQGLYEARIDRIYTKYALGFCQVNEVRTLGEVIHDHNGSMFCSTEPVGPCPEIYSSDSERLVSPWQPYREAEVTVEFHYSRQHVRGDTLRSELAKGSEVCIIGHLPQHRSGEQKLVFQPLVIGFPWLHTADPTWADRVIWLSRNFYEHFVEDFVEFAKVNEHDKPKSPDLMKHITERAFKRALAAILGDAATGDWGGETSDFVTAHLHLGSQRVTGAFLLKGPGSGFSPMLMTHLGKNADQIYRLAQEPASVLFVQHCHDVASAVRATLRAFAVQPSHPRRYCIVDGRDSLWLLQSYDLYEQALEWSK
jgi:hypothetical protein